MTQANSAAFFSFVAFFLSNALIGDAYEPSGIVKATHNTPHLTPSLKKASNDFGITYDSFSSITSNDYGKSVITLPIIIGAVGVFLLLVFIIS